MLLVYASKSLIVKIESPGLPGFFLSSYLHDDRNPSRISYPEKDCNHAIGDANSILPGYPHCHLNLAKQTEHSRIDFNGTIGIKLACAYLLLTRIV